jgi:hypothetical protein
LRQTGIGRHAFAEVEAATPMRSRAKVRAERPILGNPPCLNVVSLMTSVA